MKENGVDVSGGMIPQIDDVRQLLAENPAVEISAEDLHRMLCFDCADELLPPGAADRIRANGAYNCRGLSMEQLEQVVISLLKPSRVRHVLGCRDAAIALAKKWGADETDAGRAGLLHDITKALDGPLQLTLCRAYGTMLDDFSKENPKTLHALTGALVAQRIFGENQAVVEAVRSHTTGKANMNLLQKIIYVADYMEPNRDFPGVEELRELAFRDIDLALKTGLEMTISMLRLQNREISKESQEALQWLDERMNKTC
ncbi:MAG: bis(5'-nucleosyl)-tetraphosphatase (symmetrical) YqeK [Oscillospiraceae bacterium]|nr:bis(5'-nucleosyl)-tetraphosphatase (symmetrical) YqeK [Oscillospiraceae bacterium]